MLVGVQPLRVSVIPLRLLELRKDYEQELRSRSGEQYVARHSETYFDRCLISAKHLRRTSSKQLKSYQSNQWRNGRSDDWYHTYHTIERSHRLNVSSKVDKGVVDYWDTV